MKPIACVLACALLAAAGPARPAQPRPTHVPSQPPVLSRPPVLTEQALTRRMQQELASSQYRERADNPTLAEHRQGHNAMILKQRGTGACTGDWRDAVHESAWFGKLAKCWRSARALDIQVCPITAGRVGTQSCIELAKASFTAHALAGGAAWGN